MSLLWQLHLERIYRHEYKNSILCVTYEKVNKFVYRRSRSETKSSEINHSHYRPLESVNNLLHYAPRK